MSANNCTLLRSASTLSLVAEAQNNLPDKITFFASALLVMSCSTSSTLAAAAWAAAWNSAGQCSTQMSCGCTPYLTAPLSLQQALAPGLKLGLSVRLNLQKGLAQLVLISDCLGIEARQGLEMGTRR